MRMKKVRQDRMFMSVYKCLQVFRICQNNCHMINDDQRLNWRNSTNIGEASTNGTISEERKIEDR